MNFPFPNGETCSVTFGDDKSGVYDGTDELWLMVKAL
jgi:hypothetical protein